MFACKKGVALLAFPTSTAFNVKLVLVLKSSNCATLLSFWYCRISPDNTRLFTVYVYGNIALLESVTLKASLIV